MTGIGVREISGHAALSHAFPGAISRGASRSSTICSVSAFIVFLMIRSPVAVADDERRGQRDETAAPSSASSGFAESILEGLLERLEAPPSVSLPKRQTSVKKILESISRESRITISCNHPKPESMSLATPGGRLDIWNALLLVTKSVDGSFITGESGLHVVLPVNGEPIGFPPDEARCMAGPFLVELISISDLLLRDFHDPVHDGRRGLIVLRLTGVGLPPRLPVGFRVRNVIVGDESLNVKNPEVDLELGGSTGGRFGQMQTAEMILRCPPGMLAAKSFRLDGVVALPTPRSFEELAIPLSDEVSVMRDGDISFMVRRSVSESDEGRNGADGDSWVVDLWGEVSMNPLVAPQGWVQYVLQQKKNGNVVPCDDVVVDATNPRRLKVRVPSTARRLLLGLSTEMSWKEHRVVLGPLDLTD